MCTHSNGWRRYVLPSNWATMTMFMLLMSLSSIGQEEIQLPHGFVKIYADETVADTYVAPPAEYVPGGERAANFNVTYTGFTTQAQTAFQYAVDLWAALITSSVTIEVNANFTSLAPNVLGSAGASTIHRDFSGAPEAGTWYPQALANSLAGSDLSGQPDINANFNSDFTWYYGLDGNTPAGQYDFVTVVLHELGHGLGFFGSAYVDGSLGYIQQDGYPYIYDLFVQTGGGTDILDYSDGTSALAGALQGNNLFWTGFWGTAGNAAIEPQLYAPSSWDGGSSYSHLNESTFPSGNINSLMTPQLGSAEAIHTPGPATIGIFTDMGWSIAGGCSSCGSNC
ncbi:MAG: hypothetical protein KDC12_15775, partial [Flavobacteriales bacterium]|nr:hypothetical protein [Flavobacteriales bacterium]